MNESVSICVTLTALDRDGVEVVHTNHYAILSYDKEAEECTALAMLNAYLGLVVSSMKGTAQ